MHVNAKKMYLRRADDDLYESIMTPPSAALTIDPTPLSVSTSAMPFKSVEFLRDKYGSMTPMQLKVPNTTQCESPSNAIRARRRMTFLS
jgi:hypothetical protein